ncbi:DUF502 domain-containing protein [candidate division KSB3 bacterium]|uniref:DUF502 domain-containing protein n=1 Tax=candidate division KSB3 bacterium TaxID=2044937 RepID=A0A9D5Q4L0_9BACT|nr:DUF502 domain-containing protein [candidate division KSB3 bacterium]MBD3323670.1 DUF502 domain-containing protein [candidate division KSB3 bacterium]
MFATFRHNLRNKFIAGVVIVLPVGITVVLLGMMFQWLDKFFAPLALRLTDRQIPGLGIISTVLLIFLVGLIVTSIIGRAFVSFGEHIVAKIPLIRSIYYGAKQLLETLTAEKRRAFTEVVLIEYPKKGSYSLGFITAETAPVIQENITTPLINVFVATTPNPTTGFLLLVPQKEVTILPISVEEGIKMVVSGGIIHPQSLPIV